MMRPGHVIVACVFALLTIGVVMVNSAGMVVDPKVPVTIQGVLLSRSTIYMGVAILAMAMTSWFAPVQLLGAVRGGADTVGPSPERTSGWSMSFLWIGTLVLLAVLAAVYVPGLGVSKKGATRWLGLNLPGLGDLSVQPSEIVKWGAVLLTAVYAASMGDRIKPFFKGHLPLLIALGAVVGFMVIEDLGTAILITAVAAIMLLAAGVSIWKFIALIPVGVVALVAAIVKQPYRLERIETYVNPYVDPENTGFHMIQSMVAVHNGEIWGRGLGNGLQKFGYLPEDTTDFIFAIICEELGIFGALTVVFLYAVLLGAACLIVFKQRSPLLKLIGLGVASTVLLQAIINMGVVTALLPTKGIALPLLSSGGTGWILTAASLGVLVAMDKLVAPADETVSAAAASGGALVAIPVREGGLATG